MLDILFVILYHTIAIIISVFIGTSIGWLITTKNPTLKDFRLVFKANVEFWTHPIRTIRELRNKDV